MTMNGISEEKYTHIDEIKEQTKAVFDELMEQAKLEEGDILVVGCSSSEIASHRIGSYSSAEIGEAVAQTFLNCCKEKKIYLAAQCCEHLNRAIIIEKTAANEPPAFNFGTTFTIGRRYSFAAVFSMMIARFKCSQH